MKEMKKTNVRLVFFLVLSILVLAFIFFNSTRSGEESNSISSGLMDTILGILDPAGKLDREIVHFIIRKAAHFAEFFVLGLTMTGFMTAVKEKKSVFYKSLLLLLLLLSALSDEFIQSFTSRTSSVRDVLLDFCGALCGIGLAVLIDRLIKRKNNKKA